MAPQEWALPGTRTTERIATVDTTSIRPPFTEVPADQDHPCGCWDGWHWLGIAVEDPDIADDDGLVYERVPCRRCAPAR
jgi:hypothetical protein